MTRGQFQGCSISLSGHLHRWKRGENICQSQDKREVGKRGLHAATKAQPFISGRLVSTSQLISLVHNLICQLLHYFSAPKERLYQRAGSAWSPCLPSEPEAMASATLLKSSFLPKKAEWGATRQVAAPKPVTVSMVVRASAYADELVQTVVWFLNTSIIILHFFPLGWWMLFFFVINLQKLVCINGKWCNVKIDISSVLVPLHTDPTWMNNHPKILLL